MPRRYQLYAAADAAAMPEDAPCRAAAALMLLFCRVTCRLLLRHDAS